MNIKKICIFSIAACAFAPCFADLTLPAIFNHNMVLQREKPVNIWGTAEPNANVEVSFQSQKKSTKADKDGNWNIALDEMKTLKRGENLRILENAKVGNLKSDITFKNVVVGEVWLLAGQSNMEWTLNKTTDFNNAKARANYPLMREIQVPSFVISSAPQKDLPTDTIAWRETTPDVIASYSGVGFYFAELLMKDLDVPVGLIYTPMGGSNIRAWIADSQMAKVPFLKKYSDDFKDVMRDFDCEKFVYELALKKYEKDLKDGKNPKKPELQKKTYSGKPISWKVGDYAKSVKPCPLSDRSMQETPSGIFNAKISPIVGFSMRGVLWYQGESDSFGTSLESFADQMKLMVTSWREAWKDASIYFYQVQLTSFSTGWNFAQARIEQYKSAKALPNGGIVNIVDIGEEKNIHPHNKTDVGKRLKMAVMRDIFGDKKIQNNMVTFDNVSYLDDAAILSFSGKDANRSFFCKGEPRGFDVKIKGKWVKAPFVEIIDNKVVIHSADNSKIEGVRYLFKNWANDYVCLFLNPDMPVFPMLDEKVSAKN